MNFRKTSLAKKIMAMVLTALMVFTSVGVLSAATFEYGDFELPTASFADIFDNSEFIQDELIDLNNEIEFGGNLGLFTPFSTRNSLLAESINVGLEETNAISSHVAEMYTAEIAPFNTNPNLATTIPESLSGITLQDTANHLERWYNFQVPANRKITIGLNYHSGIYDLHLFRLNGNALNLVDVSMRGGGFELINHISVDGGTYFLAVAPFIASPTPTTFSFVIYSIANRDVHELNETAATATIRNNSINITGNIDNRFDQDWFRLNITSAGYRQIGVFGAPVGDYAVFIFNANGNQLGGFLADGVMRVMNMPVGTYFILIESFTGNRNNNNYNLVVTSINDPSFFVVNGRPFVINTWGTTLTINGQNVRLDGQYRNHIFMGVSRNGSVHFGNGPNWPVEIIGSPNVFRANHNRYSGYVVEIFIYNAGYTCFDNQRSVDWMTMTWMREPFNHNHQLAHAVSVQVSLNRMEVVQAQPWVFFD